MNFYHKFFLLYLAFLDYWRTAAAEFLDRRTADASRRQIGQGSGHAAGAFEAYTSYQSYIG